MERSANSDRVCPACRYAKISRYNSEPLCGPCLRAARESGGVTPTWIWDSLPLRQALARVDMGAVLAILRGASGMSQLDFGNLLGWSQSVVTKIERRQRFTFHDVREILRVCDELGMPRSALLPLILGREDARLESDDAAGFWGVDVDLDRREFGAVATGLAVSALLPPPVRVDRAHVRYLHAVLERLRSQDRTVGGACLLSQARKTFARARAMLDESDYTAQVGRELLVVAADLGLVSAWLAYDAGNQPLARALYGEAALLAGSSGDTHMIVHVYVNMAQQATHLARVTGRRGAAREALRFADRAADAARHSRTPTLHALISLRQALAYAQLDDEVAFRRAISHARHELDRGPDPDTEHSWTAFVTPSEITGYEAMGRIQLGDPARAADLYRTVVSDSDRSPRDRAYYQARLASATSAAGDHRTAIQEGMAILPELGGRLTSVRVLNELRPVRKAAQTDEEFCERFDEAARMLAPISA
ncbi:helix-turn-helix domain-containing protein [Sphaerimonospora mesophila]|uniref:helix-turn-helix domain-containing protein n=1 Tax=Sphaerimonospora mesophila TaxID=37483 RepID=UPI0006E3EBC1